VQPKERLAWVHQGQISNPILGGACVMGLKYGGHRIAKRSKGTEKKGDDYSWEHKQVLGLEVGGKIIGGLEGFCHGGEEMGGQETILLRGEKKWS